MFVWRFDYGLGTAGVQLDRLAAETGILLSILTLYCS
jgi:hypothetical protein